ncbi:MAG: DNA recombination protein RmuC [Paracoccaceae bacterium]|jgi:DNA recombination protein RmuC
MADLHAALGALGDAFAISSALALGVAGAAGALAGLLIARVAAPSRATLRSAEAARLDALNAADGADAARIAMDRDLAVMTAEAARAGRAEEEARALRRRLGDETTARAGAEAALVAERRGAAERIEALRVQAEAHEAATERRFGQLASEALATANRQLSDIAAERLTSDRAVHAAALDQRREAIEALIRPLDAHLGTFEARVGELEQARAGAYAGLTQQIETLAAGQARLGAETARLVQSLRAPKTRGRWGEMQLRRAFEMAGMAEHVDFAMEVSIARPDGILRPDAVLALPGGRALIIDAKTPLDAYLRALEAETPEAQTAALRDHARQMRDHVKRLAAKEYWAALPHAPDFVVMFVPGEAFYAAALEQQPGLAEDAMALKVLICSPTTLVGLAKAVAYGWQQERLTRNAREVADQARELHARLGAFGGHLSDLGRALGQSVDRYNRAVGSLEGRVLPAARRFESLGVAPEDAGLTSPGRIDEAPRRVTAPEVTDAQDAQADVAAHGVGRA